MHESIVLGQRLLTGVAACVTGPAEPLRHHQILEIGGAHVALVFMNRSLRVGLDIQLCLDNLLEGLLKTSSSLCLARARTTAHINTRRAHDQRWYP